MTNAPLTLKGFKPRKNKVLLECSKEYYITELMRMYDSETGHADVLRHIELKIDWDTYLVKAHNGGEETRDLTLDASVILSNNCAVDWTKHHLVHEEHPNKAYQKYKLPNPRDQKAFQKATEEFNKILDENLTVVVKSYVLVEDFNIIAILPE